MPPAKALAIPKAQQFAEKLHAYTLPWNDRPNTRVKDLVDLILFITADPPGNRALVEAIQMTFAARNTHLIPESVAAPPPNWEASFAEMARDAGVLPDSAAEAFEVLAKFFGQIDFDHRRQRP